MASYYDPEKNCRVGTMDESQFYSECLAGNGEYFRNLIQAWSKAGGVLKWGAGGVSLRGAVAGKEVSVCFLAPQFAGKKDRIELTCATLKKQIGETRSEELENGLRSAAGDQVLGKTMISVVQPGTLPNAKQKALTKAFLDLL
jgi:hypothetical protein